MDSELKKYMDEGGYLPVFMRDFHDQKLLFKRLNEMVEHREDNYTNNINWIQGHVYVVDIFLHYMGLHGYTLQKSRKKVDFLDIEEDLITFETKTREEYLKVLSQAVNKMKSEKEEV